ncbi:hypothetical protein SUGI_1075680 [Cryptomeria japonica]|nr:hypothetical protein SUGI_1075680 [Cryptomeria japonica]
MNGEKFICITWFSKKTFLHLQVVAYSDNICFHLVPTIVSGCYKGCGGSFPKGFVFGTASSAYQVGGAANFEGRGPNIWDTFVRTPETY